jgi:WD40 repeat protein
MSTASPGQRGGGLLAAAQQDGAVRLWDLDQRTLRRSIHLTSNWLRPVVWVGGSAGGLAVAGFDGTIWVVSPEGQRRGSVRAGRLPLWSLATDASGKLLVSGADDGTVRIWRVG